jgi:hypothetical protein
MRYKLLKFLKSSICSFAGSKTGLPLQFILCLFVMCSVSLLWAYPDEEQLPASPSVLTAPPLSLINDQPEDIIVSSDNRYVYFAIGSTIKRVDLGSWALTTDQIPSFTNEDLNSDGSDLKGDIKGLAIRSSKLYATQDDGDLAIVDLASITASPKVISISTGQLGDIVADDESASTDDKLYIADETNSEVHVFDIGDNKVEKTIDLSFGGAGVTITELLFVGISNDSDHIYVATNDGIIFFFTEDALTATTIDIDSADGNDLPAIAASSNDKLFFVLDDTDDVLRIFTVVDNQAIAVSNTPIDLSALQSTLRDLVIVDVQRPADTSKTSDVYAYVAGSGGISIIDLDLNSTTMTAFDIFDLGSDVNIDDEPLALGGSRTPRLLFSPGRDFVMTVNGDATLSVISEAPFVSISSTSLGTTALGSGGTFTVAFESTQAGTYTVRVGGDLTQNGTSLDTGSVSANTSTNTNTLTHAAASFVEGSNEIFIFVKNGDTIVGRDMVTVTVDTPPPAVTLRSTSFGNGKVFVNFDRLTDSDISSYTIHADTVAADLTGTPDFSGSVSQPASGTTVTGSVSGLTNGTTYFIAVEAVDAAGNVGTRTSSLSGSTASAIPQQIIGITGSVGENGCTLIREPRPANQRPMGILLCLLVLGLLYVGARLIASTNRGSINDIPTKLFLGAILLIITLSSVADAKELSPQFYTFEFKFGEFIPTDSSTKGFLTTCCNDQYELEWGLLFDSKYGIELGIGFMFEERNAVGGTNGAVSQDRFNFMTFPIQNSFTFRADFKENQIIVPYVKAGPDYVLFRENVRGAVTKGIKYGLHGTAGLQILLEFMDQAWDMEKSWGVNDVYLTLEAEYAYINSFKSTGLDLSGWKFSGGFLFEF